MKLKDKESNIQEEELVEDKVRDLKKERQRKRQLVMRLSHEKGKSSIKSGGRWCQPQR